MIIELPQSESVRLERDRLGMLFHQMSEQAAEDLVCRAVEELAVRLSHCEVLWRQDDLAALYKSARSLIAIADQIGMTSLATVAADVTGCISRGDRVATAATLARLSRTGQASLTAVWDLQDLSI